MQAVIIAGGKGTRILTETNSNPKSLLKINGKPILQYQIEVLKKNKVTHILLVLNYGSQKIIDFVKQQNVSGIKYDFFIEPYQLGTAGALRLIEGKLQKNFYVLYGDIMVNIDLGRFMKFHHKKGGVASIAIHPNNHPYDSDLVETDGKDKITNFHSKPHPDSLFYDNLVNAGLYILNKKITKHIPLNKQSDFGRNIFPTIVKAKKENIYGYKTHEYLKDTGTPDRYSEVIKDVESGIYQTGSRKYKKPAFFLDRDGVINEEVDNITDPADFKLIGKSADAIRKINQAGYLAIVISNQPQVAKGFCSVSTIHQITKKMEVLLGRKGAKLDEINICFHHPDKGYAGENLRYKRSCLCRKPNTAMIKRAVRDFNIDINKSYLIGDQTRDAATAINAGVRFIGVKTGYGCKDNKYKVRIGKLYKDINESVDHLINSV